jgi:hypothetical protein
MFKTAPKIIIKNPTIGARFNIFAATIKNPRNTIHLTKSPRNLEESRLYPIFSKKEPKPVLTRNLSTLKDAFLLMLLTRFVR